MDCVCLVSSVKCQVLRLARSAPLRVVPQDPVGFVSSALEMKYHNIIRSSTVVGHCHCIAARKGIPTGTTRMVPMTSHVVGKRNQENDRLPDCGHENTQTRKNEPPQKTMLLLFVSLLYMELGSVRSGPVLSCVAFSTRSMQNAGYYTVCPRTDYVRVQTHVCVRSGMLRRFGSRIVVLSRSFVCWFVLSLLVPVFHKWFGTYRMVTISISISISNRLYSIPLHFRFILLSFHSIPCRPIFVSVSVSVLFRRYWIAQDEHIPTWPPLATPRRSIPSLAPMKDTTRAPSLKK